MHSNATWQRWYFWKSWDLKKNFWSSCAGLKYAWVGCIIIDSFGSWRSTGMKWLSHTGSLSYWQQKRRCCSRADVFGHCPLFSGEHFQCWPLVPHTLCELFHQAEVLMSLHCSCTFPPSQGDESFIQCCDPCQRTGSFIWWECSRSNKVLTQNNASWIFGYWK